jgi:hypothetical protein
MDPDLIATFGFRHSICRVVEGIIPARAIIGAIGIVIDKVDLHAAIARRSRGFLLAAPNTYGKSEYETQSYKLSKNCIESHYPLLL